MGARVIQGFFVDGGAAAAPIPRGTVQRVAAPAARPGPPPAAFLRGTMPVQQRPAPGRPSLVDIPAGGQVAQRFGGDGSVAIDPAQVGLARSGGVPLPKAVLAKMEAAFGADFSGVRVHVGPQASRIGALAFATGNDLYFAPGQFDPASVRGQQLIGHELAHVVQQRQGRVRTPGSGVAVVQDHALEAEADRLGARAAMYRAPVQAKMAEATVRLSPPRSLGANRYKVSAGVGGKEVGSAVLHMSGRSSVLVTDLGVDAAHRDQGIGRMLLSQAARAGQQFGRSTVTLSSQDSGTGKLTNWYRSMGFRQSGGTEHGMPRLEASVGRLLAGGVQAKMPFKFVR